MTDTERKARRAAREAARAAHDQQEAADKALVSEAMRGVLSDLNATTRERIFATLTLDHIGSDLVPWKAAQLYSGDVDKEAFKQAVNRITEQEASRT